MRISRLIICVLAAAAPLLAFAKKEKIQNVEIVLPTEAETSRMYGTLDYGVRVQINSRIDNNNLVDLSELPSKEASRLPRLYFNSTVNEAAEQYATNLARGLGFQVGASFDTDYILKITITDLRLRVKAYNEKQKIYSSSAAVVLNWELLDADRQTVIAQSTSTGRDSSRSLQTMFNSPLDKAYRAAFAGIDWDAIARKLKKGRTAKQEANKQVDGSGNTALEGTIIRWFVGSRPQGADVSWRVISSTPDVKNTNSNFVGTTPYETTESFDIKGLTYNNSGNVQIEITCERPGYLPQKKRFNVRQAIDQKEISAQFNLVKEVVDEPATE